VTPVVFVMGTWGLSQSWWRPSSPLAQAFGAKGIPTFTEPFKWSGELGGIVGYPSDPEEEFNDRQLTPWMVAGHALRWYCRAQGWGERAVHAVAHSHGLQVLAFAAAFGQHFATAISVSGPIRHDMRPVRLKARPMIDRWLHLYDPEDLTIIEGEFLDGHIGPVYELPEADLNLRIAGFGHSGILEAPTAWTERHLFDYFLSVGPLLPPSRPLQDRPSADQPEVPEASAASPDADAP
jgi:hypothetical protein